MLDKTVRCDNCGSEAWVSVSRVDYGQLDFCAHHYNKHSTMLHAKGWNITNDERQSLTSAQPIDAPAPVGNA